jgi:cold shock protein
MATGTVKWFSVAKKYGFIVSDEGGMDVFLHMSALVAAGIAFLDDGTRVSFDLVEGTGKRSAVNLGLVPAGSSEVSGGEASAREVSAAS